MSRFVYEKHKTNEISFPLGGIGAGCIGLAGNGRLVDWEIFNRPNKGRLNGMSHFAIKAEKNGQLVDARILQGDLHSPYSGEMAGAMFGKGFGWGPKRENLSGMPHFRSHEFNGHFPLSRINFWGEDSFPGTVSLHAWSPFIPSNDLDSSLPGAFFEVEIKNTTKEIVDYTVVGALSNPFGSDNALNQVTSTDKLHQLTLSNKGHGENDLSFGDMTLTTDADDLSYQEYWFRGDWCDDLEIYWQDFTSPGRFTNRNYTEGVQRSGTNRDTGHLAVHVRLQPGEYRTVRFVITWNVPNCKNYWNLSEEYERRMVAADVSNNWKNWYATQWQDSMTSGRYAIENWSRLFMATERFQQSLFQSSLPDVALEAVSANLSTLKSPTCLRLEDGTFYGWEGTGTDAGSCEGSCTHVWNYAQALAFLFPSLERSMRAANYQYSVDEFGGSHFRILLPLGLTAGISDFRPCVDGQFGDVIKTYRDWKISGDSNWLRELWPIIRRTIEYAWSEHNPDGWDLDKTGVIWGRQHHTLDMELFGPNAWLTGYYLTALKAASIMAPYCGDDHFGKECRELFEKGRAWADKNLFNGEYYLQLIDLSDREILRSYDSGAGAMGGGKASEAYWSEEHGEIKYQVAEGCELDMTIAQWHANLYGLGRIYDTDQVRSALAATFKYNYKSSMRDVANPWRVYALNDEAGLQICSWPGHVKRPRIPLPYAQEDQGGYSYAAAIHMIQAGLVEEGLTIIKAIRDRYDGYKRNPWNEIECGSNYARSMASYSLLNAFSGFQFDLVEGYIGFSPIFHTDNINFRCFWALDGVWGEVVYELETVELRVIEGELKLSSCDFNTLPKKVYVDDIRVNYSIEGTRIHFSENPIVLKGIRAEN